MCLLFYFVILFSISQWNAFFQVVYICKSNDVVWTPVMKKNAKLQFRCFLSQPNTRRETQEKHTEYNCCIPKFFELHSVLKAGCCANYYLLKYHPHYHFALSVWSYKMFSVLEWMCAFLSIFRSSCIFPRCIFRSFSTKVFRSTVSETYTHTQTQISSCIQMRQF